VRADYRFAFANCAVVKTLARPTLPLLAPLLHCVVRDIRCETTILQRIDRVDCRHYDTLAGGHDIAH